MHNPKKSLIILFKFHIFLLINIFSLMKVNLCWPLLTADNIYNKELSNYNNLTTKNMTINEFSQKNQVDNLSKCFNIINETTIEKKTLFYSKKFPTELCLKIAISQKYKEDIYFPKYLHRCFPLCNSCSSFSTTSSDMKCISCLKGFKYINGNCYINKKYKENIRKKELSILFNTLNSYNYRSTNFIKKYMNGTTYLFKENKYTNNKRKLYKADDFDDYVNNVINRESQTSLTNDKSNCEYNFHIELSPYYILAEICISNTKYYIENNRCVDSCTPQLETYFNYPVVEIKVGPHDEVTVCDCSFRCCKKRINNLAKSLDRGYIDGSYQYFRRQDGTCLFYEEGNYYDRSRKNTYLLAQDFVPCFFPIYDNNNEIEFYISGFGKTIVGNNCLSRCPEDDTNQYYYYNTINSGCYKCPDNCIECNNIPTNENGYCTKCKEGFNIIYNGFCYEICPLYYGEESGTCRKCNNNEIYIEGKCVLYRDDTYNYGNETNPSFKDENDPKIFHKCLEFIGNQSYILSKDKSICESLECPYHYYDGLNGFCYECPKGCIDCVIASNHLYCTTCKDGYFKDGYLCEENKCNFYVSIDGNNNCYVKKCPYDYVYLDKENGETSFECIPSCQSEQNNYYNTITDKCKVRCIGDDSSVIDSEYLCLEHCDENYPENVDGVCENCALRSEFNNNGSCVLQEENFNEIYFILSGEENEKYAKVGSCYIIDERGDYHPEHIKSREYNPSLCPDDCPSNFIKKYDENNDIFCMKCYRTCESCEHTGVSGNHKCTNCKNGYEFSKRLYGVCDQICDEGDFFYYEKNREKKCTPNCPDEMPFSSENDDENIYNLECIKNCTENNQLLINNTFSCVKECPEGFNRFDLLCIEVCPQDYGVYGDSNECQKCNENNLYFYNGKCYKTEEEIPLDTYVPDNPNIPSYEEQKPGIDNDGLLHECFENDLTGIKTGYYAKINNCSKICPEGYYYSSEDEICIQCQYDCLYCHPIEGCKNECPSDYYTIMTEEGEFKCISSCPSDYPVIGSDNSCTDNCSPDEVKILYSGNDELGNSNYKCSNNKCKELNLFFYSSTQTCYQPQNIPADTYFNPDIQSDNENELSPCLTQVSDNEYITGFFYAISKCNVQCPEYFYYAGNNKCKKCHSLCKTCFGEGTNRENKCLSCIDNENRILNPYLFNCEKKCESSFHYSEETQKIVCDEECPKNNYIDEETGECISNCNKLIDNNYCVQECPEGKNEFNGYCLSNVTIPVIIITKTILTPVESTNTPIISSSKINSISTSYITDSSPKEKIKTNIIIKEEDNKDINEIGYNKEINKIIKLLERNISRHIESSENNNIETINGNFSLCEININETIIKCGDSDNILYLNRCKEKIKDYYPSENMLYLMQIDLNEKNSESENSISFSSQTKYKMYLLNGEEINITEICKDVEMKVEKKITLSNKLENNKELRTRILEDGINIFDINDPFFNDRCYPYTDENGKDIPLKNRKEDFYQNKVFCIDGCEYYNITMNMSNIICNCDVNSLIIKKDEDDKSILGYLDNNLNSKEIDESSYGTISVAKCSERAFQKENIKKNIGFWIYVAIILLALLLLSFLLCFGYDSLNSYLFQYANDKKIEKGEEEFEKEEEVITKKVVVSTYSNINSNENNYSENSNPPKKINNYNDDDNISEEKTKTRTHKKISFGYEKNKSTEYPKLSVSNFGTGYKLSNKFEVESINEYQTPTKLSEKREYEMSNGYVISKHNSGNNSKSLSLINNTKFENKKSEKNNIGSQVELEPDGALLAASNFFDTCRIVKIQNDFSEEEEEEGKYEKNIINKKHQSRNNNSNYNSLNKSNFFQPDKKIVKLPGFPNAKYEEREVFSEEEEDYKKSSSNSFNSRNKQNPLNRYNINNQDYSNELEDIDENFDDISSINERRLENGRYNNNNKNRKKFKNRNNIKKAIIRKEKESIENESFCENVGKTNYYKYKQNYIQSSLPKYNRNYINTTSSGNLSKQPITINKYYITNNTNEDNYQEKLKIRDDKKSIEENKKKVRKKIEYQGLQKENSEDKYFNADEKNKKRISKNNKNGEKIITINKKKIAKGSRFEKNGLIIHNLDIANFEDVIINDHRSFCGIYCSFLCNFQIYMSICLSNNIFVPWVVRALIGLFTFELYFTFTALLMKTTQFEKRYKSETDINIVYLIKNEYTNIIYTILITKVMNIISFYFFVPYSIIKIIRDYAYQGEIFIRELKIALYRLKCKYYIFIIIFILLTCIQGYFISCFCAVYLGSIKPWIYSSLIAFIFDLIVSFIFIFLAALFRSISICCQSCLLFMISYLFLCLS